MLKTLLEFLEHFKHTRSTKTPDVLSFRLQEAHKDQRSGLNKLSTKGAQSFKFIKSESETIQQPETVKLLCT